MERKTLKGCIKGLKVLRTSKHRTLGASVTAELDAVIQELERRLESTGEIEIDSALSMRVLQVLARSVEAATNLSTIIKWFLGSG